MTDHILTRAKAYAALIGSVLAVVATQLPVGSQEQRWAGVALAILTAVATFKVENKPLNKPKA